MTPDVSPNWESLMWETRGYIGLEDDEPVPTDELVESAKANGYTEREVREALRDTEYLEAADEGLEYVVESVDTAEPPKPAESDAEEADISTETPTPDTVEPAEEDGDVSNYRRIYLDAAERADREPWEPVEEAAIREALADEGFAHLLNNGHLFDTSWRVVDTSDEGEDPRRRWYYPSESEPRPDEFRRFHDLLTEEAPDGYEPFYFRVKKASKDPATQFGSWKTEGARLSVDEAVEWMKKGGNVGIAGRGGCRECGGHGATDGRTCTECGGTGEDPEHDGPLVNVDIDDDEATTPDDVPGSLRARSRSRTGWHTWYFDLEGEIPNIPTDEYGEIRTNWQYVVAPGSFVASCREDIPEDAEDAGYYTLEDTEPVATVEYDDLPQVFHDVAESVEEVEEDDATDEGRDEPRQRTGGESAVFDVEASDLTTKSDASERFTSIFHGSGTGANMSVSGDKLHCWRHGVAHGGLQALAVLSDKVKDGCRELGKAHKNSGAGRNKLKGDWRLVWAAWHEAKDRGEIANDDPIPYVALRELAVEEGVVDRDDLVVRDADTGDVVEEPDEYDGDTYEAFPPGAYGDALEHVEEEHDVDPGREVPEYDSGDEPDDEEAATGRELLDLDVVVEPANALAAAAAIEPDDLDEPLPELEREDVDDVAIAVAIADGMIDSTGEFPDDGRYTEAYYRARDHYGAPLPKYLDNSTLEERADLVFAALERVEPTHILDSLESDITVEDPDGKAIAKIDPTWEESESGERILAGYGRGFYCTRHSPDQPERWRTFDALQVVALEHELVRSEFRRPSGEAFKEAYRLLREQYGAPVPKWRATLLEHVAVLPPAARVLGENSADRSLETARKETEALLRDAVDVRDRGQLITNVAGSGKTFSSAIIADEKPELYTAQRNELKQQMEEYAAEIRASDDIAAEPTTRHLPILSADLFDDVVRHDAVEAVREHGRRLLRDRDELLEVVEIPDDPSEEDDEDGVDLDRATCPTASGEHGDAWALAVQTARELKINPAKIHENDTAIFGDPLPCQHDGEECPYSVGWDDVRNPDDSADILIGSPGHAKVDSATTYFDRGPDGERTEHDRAVVVDEFVGDSYMNLYGDRYLDFATWLADALVGIDTREDLVEADLDADTWVNLWLEGDGAEYADTADAIDLLDDGRKLCTARREAEAALESGVDTDAPTSAALVSVREALGELRDGTPTDGALDDVAATLNQAITTIREEADTAYATGDKTDAGRLYGLADDLEDVYKPLAAAIERDADTPLVDALAAAVDALPVGGDLRRLLEDAVDVLRGEDAPEGLLDAAITALEGGRDGCRELAIYAEDGYAHPDAWALLAGAIAQDTAVVESETFAFDGDEGSTYKRLTTNGATVLADKNQHGAIVVDPPAFTDITGDKCPVLALDATGRPELWKIALGRDVERRDIHDSDAERRGFLRENGYAVVQTTTDPLPYHSDPAGKSKNFSEDLELVRTVAEEYTGTGPDAVDDKGPAVISTKKVVDYLADDLDEHAGATINYENMKGSDALGDHQAAVILGSCHYGDAAPEMWGLLAGEDAGRGDTRGDTLDYGSDVANAYLRYMREDTTMQAILRAGRNDDDTVVFAHTGALRDDLPVVDEGVVLSAHSKGTLAVAEAAREYGTQPFTATDLVDAIAEDDRAVGRRQVQNILADLRGSGYLRVVEEGGPGVGYEYELEEEPGLADVELPEPGETADSGGAENEISPNETMNTWNFVSPDRPPGDRGMLSPSRPTIPATEAAEGVADGVEPPG